jgi:protocatechuate 3,4-dioxygenase beta subunit
MPRCRTRDPATEPAGAGRVQDRNDSTEIEMSQRPNNLALLRRRHAILALSAIGVAPIASGQSAATRVTPSQTLGPFYPRDDLERPEQTDADLLVFNGDKLLSRGTPLYFSGRVVNRLGSAVAQAPIEIWQCDANAVYHHPAGGAVSERDPHFQGYGVALTDADGRFHFRTIKPVPYPGRTPHIHVRVAPRDGRALATQLYLSDEPGNGRDFLFRQLSREERAALTMALRPTQSKHPLAQGTQVTATSELIVA